MPRCSSSLAASSLPQARERLDEIDRYLHGREFEVSRILRQDGRTRWTLWDFDS